MASCKDCVHVDVCKDYAINYLKGTPIEALEREVGDYPCCRFQDRSLFVELPCKVGDIVYCDLDKTINPATKRKYGNAAENYPLEECVIMEIIMNKSDKEPLFTVVNYDIAEFTKFWQSEFGKYVFTKEQYQKLKPTKLSVRKAMKTDGLDI